MPAFSFNPATAPVNTMTRDPLPDGDYEMVIVRSDLKPTKSGDGEYIELEMQVTDGPHTGRRLWERLNVNNPSKKAEDIARAALAQLCVACGVSDMQDTEQLHDIPFIASVEIERKDPTRNRVMSYKAAGARKPAAPAAPARPAAPAATGARPWAR